MSNLSVDGLVSGLDTTALVRSLMQLERQPVVRLQARTTELQRVVDLYRQMNTRFDAVETAARKVTSADGWSVTTATSTDESVATVTTSGAGKAGVLTFEVTALARAHSVVVDATVADPATDMVAGGDVTIGSTTIAAASLGGGTMDEVAAAINASDAGVRATVVQVAPGQHKLQLTAEGSGAASAFEVTGLGPTGVVSQGTDARLTVGDGPGAYEITSPTNTFTGVLDGVTITARGLGSTTVEVASDTKAIADGVEALVKAVNDATGLIRANSGYNAESGTAGMLLSDRGADQLRRSLTDAISRTVIDGRVANDFGLTVDRHGVVTFDRDKFVAALDADPAAVQSFFSANEAGTADDGVAEQLRRVAEEATRFGTGRISVAIEQRESRISALRNQIDGYETRLSMREASYRRQFAALESALGSMQSQSTWLAGAINALPRPNL